MTSLLFNKIYGALAGSAVGDALGGPVEGWSYTDIERVHNRVEKLLPYEKEPSYHGPFQTDAGAYTDDTRLLKILCEACLYRQGPPSRGDVKKVIAERFYSSKSELERGFLEEYAMKAIYGVEKEAFGGQATNGGIMAVAPMGLVVPCNPYRAYEKTFEALFFCTGYARTATAIAAAMISAAMIPGITVDSIVSAGLDASRSYKSTKEGSIWTSWEMYGEVAQKSENLLINAVKLAREYMDVNSIKEELFETVTQEFFADGAETLAIGTAMFVASDGNFREAVLGAVNYGRDNDSSASLSGALSGAYQGVEAIDRDWLERVESVNQAPRLSELSQGFTDIVRKQFEADLLRLESYKTLLSYSS